MNTTIGPEAIGGRGIFGEVIGGGGLNVTVDDTDIDNTALQGIFIDFQEGASREVVITDNELGQTVPVGNSSEVEDGFTFVAQGGGTYDCGAPCPTGTVNFSMTGNWIGVESSGGIAAVFDVRDMSVANLTVTGNTFNNGGSFGAADFVAVVGGPEAAICLHLRENSAIGSEGACNLANVGGGHSTCTTPTKTVP